MCAGPECYLRFCFDQHAIAHRAEAYAAAELTPGQFQLMLENVRRGNLTQACTPTKMLGKSIRNPQALFGGYLPADRTAHGDRCVETPGGLG